ncbi:unnamed protein product [Schistocephalus solidus]|uniref:EGF-like domain-containing protein n=1 Tax=Schistocephalus solidus TaxID=70667 RepID=A0A183ST16_SCHSO|nr:unnamed protein product [Schistocephalus solidus]
MTSGVITCICRGGYMGTDCSEELDACAVGSEVYDVTSRAPEEGTFGVDRARSHIPPGFKACATTVNSENRCIPQLGTSSYYCRCSEGYAMDASLSYDNCLSRTTPCASQICIEGSCISSKFCEWSVMLGYFLQDGQQWMCDCDDGYTGTYCDKRVGEWSAWSTWTLCDPYCGPRRQRKRLRVCLSENQTDCTGAVENVS